MRKWIYVSLAILLAVSVMLLLSCSGGGSTPASVTTTLSDPATCGTPQGPFSHVYVTVTDVLIHQSANAPANDPAWVDLTPGLKNNPVQVDLLGVSNQCFLATLGSQGIAPGSYQQVRVILAKDNVSIAGNKCGLFANCVMLASDPLNTPIDLQLSSESQTGIKIPSGQMAGGQFVVAAGDKKDFNIDFNACASMVVQGNGQYRLKPVLHAGEVAQQSTSTSISGTVIDNSTQQPIPGNVVVALEQTQNGVDRVIMETVTGSNGTFSFCPVPAGTYDVVISAINGTGVAYATTVITGTQPGNALGNIPMTQIGAPATILGQITTSTGSAATAADIEVSALQSNGANLLVTVPLAQQSAATLSLATAAGTCPANTDCVSYSLSVPAATLSIGTFTPGPSQTPAAPSSTSSANYTVDANAFIPGSAGLADCSSPNLQTNMTSANATLTVNTGSSVTAATLTFSGCQ